ncbi:hypothetical protein C8R44DRAFT_308257 [Mycena epipterygia]|nr:hypothetical protein C8R44DRAFT_308257 [Mycena epipterygia]
MDFLRRINHPHPRRVNWDLHVAGILTQVRVHAHVDSCLASVSLCTLLGGSGLFLGLFFCGEEPLEGRRGDMCHTTCGVGCRLNFAVASGYLALAITWLNGSQRLNGMRSFAGVVAAIGNLPSMALRVTVTEALCAVGRRGWGAVSM